VRRIGMSATIALAAALCLGAAPAHAQSAGPALEPCPDVPAALHVGCGSITVPLDRANPDLGTTRIAFAVVPRRDTSRPSLGTVFGPHGPGAALIPATPQLVQDFGPLLDRRDLLIMDPRGTGGSDPVLCSSLEGVTSGGLTPPAELTAAIGACGSELGPRAGSYGIAAVVDDLDAVRATLGIERLDLWGRSYGTHLSTVYAGRHPEHVRSIVLSGTYPIAYDPFGLDKLAAARRGVRLTCARTHACDGDRVLRDWRIGSIAGRSHSPCAPGTDGCRCGSTTARWPPSCGAAATRSSSVVCPPRPAVRWPATSRRCAGSWRRPRSRPRPRSPRRAVPPREP
jgi:pimeloyl-ACP methyl ester carboxylesterase